jgi:hypothetical protein
MRVSTHIMETHKGRGDGVASFTARLFYSLNRRTHGPQTRPRLRGKEKNPWRVLSSGMWHRVVWQKFVEICKEPIASIFGVEDLSLKEAEGKKSRARVENCLLLSSYFQSAFFFCLFLGVGWDWVHLVRRPLTGLLYQRRMIDDDDECGAVGGMRIGRGNRSAPVPLCLPQVPHDLTWARNLPVWRWRQYATPKLRWTSAGHQGATSQVNAVRTPNPTYQISDLSRIEHVSAIRNQSLYRQRKFISDNSALWLLGDSL